MTEYFVPFEGLSVYLPFAMWKNIHLCLSVTQEAIAEEQRMAARYANDVEIAKSQRDFELKKAAYDQEVQTKKAASNLAYDLQVMGGA